MAPKKRPRCSESSPSTPISLSDSDVQSQSKSSGTQLVKSTRTSTTVKTTKNQNSWVWKYFKTESVQGIVKYVCQAAKPAGSDRICGTTMTPDQSQSTKSLSRHLKRYHNIFATTNTQQGTLKSFLETGSITKVMFERNPSILLHWIVIILIFFSVIFLSFHHLFILLFSLCIF